MSDTLEQRIEYNAKEAPDGLMFVFPTDILELIDNYRAQVRAAERAGMERAAKIADSYDVPCAPRYPIEEGAHQIAKEIRAAMEE